jgi:NAD(P)H-dependent glutamate synthase small subunit
VADPLGFVKFERVEVGHREVENRVWDYREVDFPHPVEVLTRQAARCMDCGTPFCHGSGCPVKNRIPEFNDLIFRGRWREASAVLHATNNFPEITGRVCPAPCEAACTLSINDDPVLIKHIEYQIAERAFAEGWIEPVLPQKRSGARVAVIGSGPAGLAAAQQLGRAGHHVVVFEKDDRVGGLLRYGIPDFKLDKQVLDRRLAQLLAEGVRFETGVAAGEDLSARYLRKTFDAICLTMGAGVPRRLGVPGAGFENVHLAMDFLTQQNRVVAGDRSPLGNGDWISAKGKHVVVIGGGDTGSDCVGTSIRQGAKEVHQLEILPKPPDERSPSTPWPTWPLVLRTSTSHEEGCQRRWSVQTRSLTGGERLATELHGCEVDWFRTAKGWEFKERPGSEFTLKVDLVLLAMGFVHVEHSGLLEHLGLTLDPRGNVATTDYMTDVPGIFAAGDTVRGASLVVHAINSGREAAAAMDRWLRSR